MKIYSFKELIVWQKSIDLVCSIYKMTENFPRQEQYGLTSQMRRSSISIPSNIAEGRSRSTGKEFCRFLAISDGSAAELETQVEVSFRLKLVSEKEYTDLLELVNEIKAMLGTMIRKLNPIEKTF